MLAQTGVAMRIFAKTSSVGLGEILRDTIAQLTDGPQWFFFLSAADFFHENIAVLHASTNTKNQHLSNVQHRAVV